MSSIYSTLNIQQITSTAVMYLIIGVKSAVNGQLQYATTVDAAGGKKMDASSHDHNAIWLDPHGLNHMRYLFPTKIRLQHNFLPSIVGSSEQQEIMGLYCPMDNSPTTDLTLPTLNYLVIKFF